MTVSVITHTLRQGWGRIRQQRGSEQPQGFSNVSQVLSGTFQAWKPESAGAAICGIEVEARSPTLLTFARARSRVQTQARTMSNY